MEGWKVKGEEVGRTEGYGVKEGTHRAQTLSQEGRVCVVRV